MKRFISISFGILFTIIQTILPLNTKEISLSRRWVIGIIFSLIWITYSIFAEKIDKKIWKLSGHRWDVKTNEEKISHFRENIVPKVLNINISNSCSNVMSDFDFLYLYNIWCEILCFLVNECIVIENNKPNYDIIRNSKYESVGYTRYIYIDKKYVKEMIKVLEEFDKKHINRMKVQKDYIDIKNQLEKVKEIFYI